MSDERPAAKQTETDQHPAADGRVMIKLLVPSEALPQASEADKAAMAQRAALYAEQERERARAIAERNAIRRQTLRELAATQAAHAASNAERTLTVSRKVEMTDYAFFSLDDGGADSSEPGAVTTSGASGVSFLSQAREHVAEVRLEVWTATPPRDTSAKWEIVEANAFRSYRTVHEITGAIDNSTAPFNWNAQGAYGVRAHCTGRAALARLLRESANLDDKPPVGIERWLIQVWPMPEAPALLDDELPPGTEPQP
jgi:hypothetical protein